MKAVFLSPLCLALFMGALSAQADRPVDDIADVPSIRKPLGAIEKPWDPIEKPPGTIYPGEAVKSFEQLLKQEPLPADYPPPAANWNELGEWLKENYPRWERLSPGPGVIPIPYELKPGDDRQERRAPVGAEWKIGVQLAVGANGEGSELRIDGLAEGLPAKNAGLRRGDVLLELNKLKLRDFQMLADLIQIVRDQEIALTVRRGDAQLTVRLTPRKLGAKPGEDPLPTKPLVPVEPKAKPKLKPATPPRVQLLRRVPPVTPEERRFERLHQDNKEIQALLRELIGEVKKLGD